MGNMTKAELEQQVDDLERRLRAVDSLDDTARTLSAIATWDREAQAISRCVKAIDPLVDSSHLPSTSKASATRLIQYLALRYGVRMADPDLVDQLVRERDELQKRVAEFERDPNDIPF